MPQHSANAPTSAVVALDRIGAELTRLTERLARVEAAIGRVVGDAGPATAELILDLQEIDLARQEAEALCMVLANVADALPSVAPIDINRALDGLTLGSLAERLSGSAIQVSRPVDIVLFD